MTRDESIHFLDVRVEYAYGRSPAPYFKFLWETAHRNPGFWVSWPVIFVSMGRIRIRVEKEHGLSAFDSLENFGRLLIARNRIPCIGLKSTDRRWVRKAAKAQGWPLRLGGWGIYPKVRKGRNRKITCYVTETKKTLVILSHKRAICSWTWINSSHHYIVNLVWNSHHRGRRTYPENDKVS